MCPAAPNAAPVAVDQAAPAPILRFYRLIDAARPPQRADRSAAGTLPTRAFRYCEAVTSATGYGWWVFPPTGLALRWDGSDIFWRCAGLPEWLPLAPAAQFPHQSARFDAAAPPDLAGCSPPFLTALPEPGAVQIWTGLMARSAPGWSLLLRAPANLPATSGIVLWEGMLETDRWFGPLFTNLRLTRTDRPVLLDADLPLLLAQPVPRIAYAETTLAASDFVPDMGGLTDDDWRDYHRTIVAPSADPDRAPGRYAVAARKRARAGCPFGNAAAAPVTVSPPSLQAPA
ncbi:MAG: hypothetical protein KGL52_07445 [Rhodospirillales bacterium]|jgi:hypothetical protein|nr:hypothetical protein [Rhodospirillales bacterium]